jgi:hypothetical protein
MGKRAPAGSAQGGKPPSGNKFGGHANAAAAGVKKNPFDLMKVKSKHQVANARARTANIAKSRTESIEKVCSHYSSTFLHAKSIQFPVLNSPGGPIIIPVFHVPLLFALHVIFPVAIPSNKSFIGLFPISRE